MKEAFACTPSRIAFQKDNILLNKSLILIAICQTIERNVNLKNVGLFKANRFMEVYRG